MAGADRRLARQGAARDPRVAAVPVPRGFRVRRRAPRATAVVARSTPRSSKPPRSTEQILHPEKYAADEKPIAVDISRRRRSAATRSRTRRCGASSGSRCSCARTASPADAARARRGRLGRRSRAHARARRRHAIAAHAIGVARFEWDAEADAIEAHDAASRALDVAIARRDRRARPRRARAGSASTARSRVERSGTPSTIAHRRAGAPARRRDASRAVGPDYERDDHGCRRTTGARSARASGATSCAETASAPLAEQVALEADEARRRRGRRRAAAAPRRAARSSPPALRSCAIAARSASASVSSSPCAANSACAAIVRVVPERPSAATPGCARERGGDRGLVGA